MVEIRGILNKNEKQDRHAQCLIYTENRCFEENISEFVIYVLSLESVQLPRFSFPMRAPKIFPTLAPK